MASSGKGDGEKVRASKMFFDKKNSIQSRWPIESSNFLNLRFNHNLNTGS